MSNDQLDDLFKSMQTPSVNSKAKAEAIQMATEAFEQEFSASDIKTEKNTQGSKALSRPISNLLQTYRNNIMAVLSNKLFYSGVATLSIAALGVVWFQQSQQVPGIIPAPLEEGVLSDNIGHSSPAMPAIEEEQVSIAKRESLPVQDMDASELLMEPMEVTAAPKPVPFSSSASSVALEKKRSQKSLAFSAGEAEDRAMPQVFNDVGRDQFEHKDENSIKQVSEEPVSTFSIDVDTASYSFVRRQLNQGVLPQKDAIRVEELVNYFDYDYPLPETREKPFASSISVYPSPWNEGKELVHIGIKGFDVLPEKQPRSNLVLLLDVSGSMDSPDKLPLVKQSMELLLSSLHPEDTIGIVVYAGAAGMVLEPTAAKETSTIMNALNNLQAGGSTAGAEGIKLAYELVEDNFAENAVNRVILATDGDFNVGITNRDELQGFVERKREKGIFLSVLGFGQGNYHDHTMQVLAQNGNGVAAYIDSFSEAQKVLVDEATSTLFPIAKDVKIQVEFNPNTVAEHRLVGYETRHLNREDFNNDAVDAGDIGAGHTVTAIYEITPKGSNAQAIDPLRYGKQEKTVGKTGLDKEYGFLKVRYKLPKESTSRLIEQPINRPESLNNVSGEASFATAVAGFAQLLKGSQYIKDYAYDDIISAAQAYKGKDPYGYRTEFIQLVRKAKIADAL